MVDLAGYAAAPEADRPEVAHLNALIDAAWKAKRDADPARTYLGGSRLGETCERRLGYEFTKAPQDAGKGFSGRLYRIFERGHDAEARMVKYLREAGFDLLTERANGGQWGFAVARREDGTPRIAGHIDGVLMQYLGIAGDVEVPVEVTKWASALPFPLLWEHKGLKHSSWLDTKRKGVKASKPLYYAQMQVYMAYMQLQHALFTAECQDTCEIFPEVVPFDAKAAQEASDRGVRVVSAETVTDLPRITRTPTDYRCRSCPFAERCWAQPVRTAAGGMSVPMPPSWGWYSGA
jgi:hypothetical protein